MQFCSVGAKNIEAKKLNALAHGVVLGSDFTGSITDYESLYNATKLAITFLDGYAPATLTFKTTPLAGVRDNKLYIATSTGMNDTVTEYTNIGGSKARPYPADGSRSMTAELFCLRYLCLHDISNSTGLFNSDNTSAIDFDPAATRKLGTTDWNGITPRLMVFPDTDTDDTSLAIDRRTAGSTQLYSTRDNSIYRYIGYGYFGNAHVDMDSLSMSFWYSGQEKTFSQGKNGVGQFKRKSLSVFQGCGSDSNGALVTNWRWTYTSYRGMAKNLSTFAGESGEHPFYVAKTAPNDSAKTVGSVAGGLEFFDTMHLLVLRAGEDFAAVSGLPTDILNIKLIKDINLFKFYSLKI